jgi:hypothetical protein
VSIRDWKSIANAQCKPVFGYHAIRRELAKQTAILTMIVQLSHTAEIGIIPIALRGVAGIAERLQIVLVVRAALGSWDNVIDFERLLLSGNAAEFTPELSAFEDLVTECSGDIACRRTSMRPDLIAALGQKCVDCLVACFNQVSALIGADALRSDKRVSGDCTVVSPDLGNPVVGQHPANHVLGTKLVVFELRSIVRKKRCRDLFNAGLPSA